MSSSAYIQFVIHSIAGIIIMILGTIGNACAIFICLRKDLRKIPTFVFYAFMLVADISSLYYWNLNHLLETFYGFILQDLGLWYCKVGIVFQIFSFEASAWLLVALSFERFLSIQIKTWRKQLFNAKKAAVVAAFIYFSIFCFNASLFITIQVDPTSNVSIRVLCYNSPYYIKWVTAYPYIYSVVPFFLLVIINGLLLGKTVFCKKVNSVAPVDNSTQKNKKRTMTFSIILVTVAFIVFTLPSSVAGGIFLRDLKSLPIDQKDLIAMIYLLNNICFFYHSFNFVLFLKFNSKFRDEVLKILKIKKEGENQSVQPSKTSIF